MRPKKAQRGFQKKGMAYLSEAAQSLVSNGFGFEDAVANTVWVTAS